LGNETKMVNLESGTARSRAVLRNKR
jgi:hypothetical protein